MLHQQVQIKGNSQKAIVQYIYIFIDFPQD